MPIHRVEGVVDNATANLFSVFKWSVLIPVPLGTTTQDIRLMPVPLRTEAMSPQNRHRLSISSIAVALGVGSLKAICFEARNHLLEFLRRNAVLAGTLITCHGRSFIIWIEADVPHRIPLSISHFSVMTDGKVLVYDRGVTGAPSYFLTTARPVRVDLEALDWGPDADGQIAAWLTSLRHGEFFRRNRRGAMRADVGAWTDYLARRLKSDLQYRRSDRSFLARNPDFGTWTPIGETSVVSRIMETVRIAPIGPEAAKTAMDEKWIVSMLLPKLRAARQADPVPADPFLAEFLGEAVVPQKGASFTLGELYGAYDRLRAVRGWPSFSRWDLGKSLRRLMAEPPYLKRISKSVHRENGSNDGYRGFAIRLPDKTLPSMAAAAGPQVTGSRDQRLLVTYELGGG